VPAPAERYALAAFTACVSDKRPVPSLHGSREPPGEVLPKTISNSSKDFIFVGTIAGPWFAVPMITGPTASFCAGS